MSESLPVPLPPQQQPRVLVLFEYPSLNGGENSFLACIAEIRDAGFSVHAAAPPAGPLAAALAAHQVPLLPLPCGAAQGQQRSLLERRSRLHQFLTHERPDLVHANSLSMSRLVGPVAARLQLPSLGHLRDMLRLSATAVTDLGCNSRLLAVSQATREWFIAAGLDGDKIETLYNGVDLQRYAPRPATGYLHRQYALPVTAQLIGTIGQIGMRKGLDVLLQAAVRIVRQAPHAHFLIVGQRHSEKEEAVAYEQQLQRLADDPGLRGHIHFLGRRSDIPTLLNELTLLVHTARQEPLGRVLLEAAAAGAAIVATDVGGTGEIFPPRQRAARTIGPDDPAVLAAEVCQLLASPQTRTQLSVAARRRAVQAFDARRAGRTLARHYHQLLAAAQD